MKALSIVKAALQAARRGQLAVAPAVQVRTGGAVPCRTPAPIAAINTANGSGSATIKLAPRCTHRRTVGSSPDVMPDDTGPPTTSPITLNGFRTTTGIGHRPRSAR